MSGSRQLSAARSGALGEPAQFAASSRLTGVWVAPYLSGQLTGFRGRVGRAGGAADYSSSFVVTASSRKTGDEVAELREARKRIKPLEQENEVLRRAADVGVQVVPDQHDRRLQALVGLIASGR